MKKEEFGVLIAFVLCIFVIGFFGRFTGNAVNESSVECNIADINGDGIVNYVDKVDFAREYDLNYGTENYCGFLDVNEDEALNILDSNKYSELYAKNYGGYTGGCIQRKLVCEENKGEVPFPELDTQSNLAQKKLGIIQKIKEVLKTIFK